jgi:tRNA nucleotidyltransferase (CCA-adding enzyme)
MSVLSHLTKRASDAVLSGTEKDSISKSISTLKNRIDSYFGSDVTNHFQFGSSTRGTILPRSMDGHSDIDYMVIFKDDGSKPQTFLNRLKRFVDYYYSRSEIYQSSPTIVLELNHIKFELVPAKEVWGQKYIPDGKGDWMTTNPNDFNDTLTEKIKIIAI